MRVAAAPRRRGEPDLRRREYMLPASAQQIRTLARRLLRAQESERARIARELHDDISQQLAMLEHDILGLTTALPDAAAHLVDPVVQRARLITRSVHELSHRLHPARLRLLGLVPTIQGFAAEMSRAAGIPIAVHYAGVPPELPPKLTVCVFRVVQEALQNACKHSFASRVRVHASADATHLRVVVEDDGRGFDVHAAWGRGLGLISMAERLAAVGGALDVQSAPAAHTRIGLVVPLASHRVSS